MRLTITDETATAVADALSYYLTASSDNFGAGFGEMHPADAAEAKRERKLVAAFIARLTPRG